MATSTDLSNVAMAATSSNANSALGINLNNVNYFSSEQPFLNIFRTTGVAQSIPSSFQGGWFTHSVKKGIWNTNEQLYLQVDANGYPTTLTAKAGDPNSPQLFDSVGVLLNYNLGKSNGGTGLPYRAGQYIVAYDGEGTIAVGQDAVLVTASPGRYVINVATPTVQLGMSIFITATDPNHTGNYLRNIRVVKAEEESLLNAGNVFEPSFLSLLQNFHVLRFMQWLEIDNNGGLVSTWASRPQVTDGGWGTGNGVPLEIPLQLCNAVGADCWLNVPHTANNDYITQMATLAHTTLGTSQKVYIEFSNEVWNSSYAQYNYAAQQGQAMWPSANTSAPYYNRSWYGMRAAQTCDIWKSVWGSDSGRVVCILGAQAQNAWTATQSLQCPLWTGAGNAPCSAHGINVVAIAPYFGIFAPQPAWTSASDGGLADVFQEINQGGLISGDYPGGELKMVSSWETSYKAALAPYNLPYIAYEGGQSLLGFPQYSAGSAISNLYIAANRDPRMGAAYTTALNNWKTNGGETYVLYEDSYIPGTYGEWGALESFMDTVSPLSAAPAKWQAIQNFMSANACWWAGCTGAIGSTSSTPAVPVPPVLTVK